MNISFNWLKELTATKWSVEETAERLTLCGTACEEIEATNKYFKNVVVGLVIDISAIEGASQIRLTSVNVGAETLSIVCGAPNVEAGDKVAVALIGAVVNGDMKIKKAKIRGVESFGMICSERELGISEEQEGIMVLGDDAEIGSPVVEYLKYNDHVMTFELTPNRGDSMSAIGIARDIASLANSKVNRPSVDLKESSTEKASDIIKVSIKDSVGCPRYSARVIKNLKMAPSPWWLKQKLLTAGIRPINNLVDITNFVMLETGHPLHAFDLNSFGSDEVVVRKAKEKEKFITLDGTEHELSDNVTLITNGKVAVAAGGVMGGLDSEIKDNTTDILLECAYFNPKMIRQSRKKLGIVTESSNRFEKGVDPNGLEYAINRAAYLYQELASGEIAQGIVDCYPSAIAPLELTLRETRCNSVLGTNISSDRMKEILNSLEFESTGSNPINVIVPTFRSDIEREIDLIEEIVRIEGYDSIPDVDSITGPLFTPIHWEDQFKRELRETLTAAGFDEMIAHGMAHSKMASYLSPDENHLKLLNPVSEEVNIMRRLLAPTALSVASHNIARRNMNLQLFEIGKVYYPPDKDDNWIEEEKLMLLVSGSTDGNWRDKPRKLDFYDLKGALDSIWDPFGSSNYKLKATSCSWMDNNQSFSILFDNKEIGVIGKVSVQVAKKFDIKEEVYLLELSLSQLIASGNLQVEFSSLPKYPSAPRDLAIVVDTAVKSSDIIKTVKESAGKLAERVSIFDLYTGKQIEKGKKSIAISINYRSPERNLTGDEIDACQKKVIETISTKFKAEIRDK